MKYLKLIIFILVLSTPILSFSDTKKEFPCLTDRNLKCTFVELKASAKQGDVKAQEALANRYYTGQGVERNYGLARHWYFQAAAQNSTVAKMMLLGMHSTGLGDPDVYQSIIKFAELAASNGNAEEKAELADRFRYGRELPRDAEKAAYWYERAAEEGHADSQFALGGMLEQGIGIKKDAEKAVYWYEQAVEKGHTGSQFALGNALQRGIGKKKEAEKAIYWYEQAAGKGHIKAQYALYYLYFNGSVIPKDHGKALYWLKESLKTGNWKAAEDIGQMYLQGYGVPVDEEKAANFYLLATLHGETFESDKLVGIYQRGFTEFPSDDVKTLKFLSVLSRIGVNLTVGQLEASKNRFTTKVIKNKPLLKKEPKEDAVTMIRNLHVGDKVSILNTRGTWCEIYIHKNHHLAWLQACVEPLK